MIFHRDLSRREKSATPAGMKPAVSKVQIIFFTTVFFLERDEEKCERFSARVPL
jgi:hypothetical protein